MHASTLILALVAVAPLSVHSHGQMMEPKPRPVSTKYRADAGALRQAGESELQWSPLEQLSQRKQKDFPEAATFDVMNGCRGTVYEADNPVTELSVGVEFPIKWFIQAPHPGYGEFNIVKPKTKNASGKIMYEKVVTLKRLKPFGTDGGNFDTTATVPTSVIGCEKAGDCALQMYWHSDIANQTYPTCSDITIKGSGAGTAGGINGSSASVGSEVNADAGGEADNPVTVAPADDGYDEYKAPAAVKATTKAPKTPALSAAASTTTPATPKTPAPTATKSKKSKCKVKSRSLRQ